MSHESRARWLRGKLEKAKEKSVQGDSIWVGERRVGGIPVSGFTETAGLGQLPQGRVSNADAVRSARSLQLRRGARARLLRNGVLIAEDLYIGALLTQKTLGNRLEAREAIGFLRQCVVSTGYGDVRLGDHIEVYTRAETAGVDPDLVPGYQVLPDHRRVLGHAQVHEVISDPLAGPVAQVDLTGGKLTGGDRVRIMRGGRPVAEALRLLSITDLHGRLIGELGGRGRASLRLGYTGVRAGDVVVAFDVPLPAQTEARTHLLQVHQARANATETRADVVPLTKSLSAGQSLVAGRRARVLREGTVIADGLTIGAPEQTALGKAFRWSATSGGFRIVLNFPGLRRGDKIEPYHVIPAR